MPTIQSVGPDASTRYLPEHPAVVRVFDRRKDGNPTPEPKDFGTWPAWHARALAELIAHPVDPGTILRRAGYQYEPRAAALSDAAHMLLEDAEGCRRARFTKDASPYRLGGRFFHTRTEGRPAFDGYLSMQDQTILSLMAEAVIALAGAEVPEKHAAPVRELIETNAWWTVMGTSSYPSIPPAREADLAAQGYTVAELLLDMAAAHVLNLAHYFETVTGPQRGAFVDAARQAKLYAVWARKVIARGVLHTLNGEPVEFERAESGADTEQ